MKRNEIEVMIQLIEEEYSRKHRNTPDKMAQLIEKEFNVKVAPFTIYKIVGIDEDYEREQRRIEYGTGYY